MFNGTHNINVISGESSLLTLARCVGNLNQQEVGDGVVFRYNKLQDPNTANSTSRTASGNTETQLLLYAISNVAPKVADMFFDQFENALYKMPFGTTSKKELSSANISNSMVQVIPSAIWKASNPEGYGLEDIETAMNVMNNSNFGVFIQPSTEVSDYLTDGFTTKIVESGAGVKIDETNNVITSGRIQYGRANDAIGLLKAETFGAVRGIIGN